MPTTGEPVTKEQQQFTESEVLTFLGTVLLDLPRFSDGLVSWIWEASVRD